MKLIELYLLSNKLTFIIVAIITIIFVIGILETFFSIISIKKLLKEQIENQKQILVKIEDIRYYIKNNK